MCRRFRRGPQPPQLHSRSRGRPHDPSAAKSRRGPWACKVAHPNDARPGQHLHSLRLARPVRDVEFFGGCGVVVVVVVAGAGHGAVLLLQQGRAVRSGAARLLRDVARARSGAGPAGREERLATTPLRPGAHLAVGVAGRARRGGRACEVVAHTLLRTVLGVGAVHAAVLGLHDDRPGALLHATAALPGAERPVCARAASTAPGAGAGSDFAVHDCVVGWGLDLVAELEAFVGN
mmetsp:Transcript_5364/g.22724  ORF Transcript_5364/g.22724 Transcript_5364/m.22724 type:complete len:234 (-) Transcript_5364:386-1087(-)